MTCTRVLAITGTLLAAGVALLSWGARLATQAAAAAAEIGDSPVPDTAERLLVGMSGLGIGGAGAWVVTVTLVCLHDLARGRAHTSSSRPWRPRALRAVLLRACVPAVGAAALCTGTPVAADTADDVAPGGRATARLAVPLAGLPLPERPMEHARLDVRRGPTTHVVRPGECLWTIAADAMGAGATPAAVDRAWRALYRVNRRLIGDDPDLVLPAQHLQLPASLQPSR